MNDSTENQSMNCISCGIPWVDHMGIIGTCAENAQLKKERDEARYMYCHLVENSRPHGISSKNVAKGLGWDCYKEDTK